MTEVRPAMEQPVIGLDRDTWLGETRAAIEKALAAAIPPEGEEPKALAAAMRASLLAPAKRVRAFLTLQVAADLGASADQAMASAVAVELVHAASLVLDDLPCMDDAQVRRGRPAVHRVYGDATAILAAIALMNRSYEVVAEDRGLSAEARVAMVQVLTHAIGTKRLTGGQQDDLAGTVAATVPAVRDLFARKTGALFSAATELGALAAGADARTVQRFAEFGDRLGIAFQMFDDLLDLHASSDAAGKDVGQDCGKTTILSLLGPGPARREAEMELAAARRLMETPIRFARTLGYTDLLADLITSRLPKL